MVWVVRIPSSCTLPTVNSKPSDVEGSNGSEAITYDVDQIVVVQNIFKVVGRTVLHVSRSNHFDKQQVKRDD